MKFLPEKSFFGTRRRISNWIAFSVTQDAAEIQQSRHGCPIIVTAAQRGRRSRWRTRTALPAVSAVSLPSVGVDCRTRLELTFMSCTCTSF